MPIETQTTQQTPSLGELVEHLMQFDGPPDQFLLALLEIICATAPADNAAILRPAGDERVDVITAYPKPESNTAPVWLAKSVQIAAQHASATKAIAAPFAAPDQFYGQQLEEHLIIAPIRHPNARTSGRLLAAFKIRARTEAAVIHMRDRLELMTTMLVIYEMRMALQARSRNLDRLQGAMEVVAAIGEQPRFQAAAMGMCNQVATRWKAERVSLGFHRGRYIKLRALSHTEKFTRKMKLAQDIEATMEECFDQDSEVIHPASEEATYVSRAAGNLALAHGPTTVLSLPLRQEGEPVAVLTLERRADQPWDEAEVETLRLLCDLAAPWLDYLHDKDRWFGARWADSTKEGAKKLLGPKHTWAKLTAVLVTTAILLLIFLKGEYRVDAPFTLEAKTKQIVPVPFDSYLEELAVIDRDELGDPVYVTEDTPVRAGQLLAILDTTRLLREQDNLVSERTRFEKERQAALREGQTVEKQIAEAEIAKVNAQLRVIEYQLQRAKLVAPADGVITRGDHRQNIGAPVSTGDVLFEIAPLAARPVVVNIPAEQASKLTDGLRGEFIHADHPDTPLPFVITNPNTESESDVVPVTIRLLDSKPMQDQLPWIVDGATGTATLRFEKADALEGLSFTMGQSDTLEAELRVDESKIADVEVGDRGTLAAASHPGRYIAFEVVRISPVAEVVEQGNIFRVTVKLLNDESLNAARQWARPGIEGLAKIDKGKKPYIVIWTKDLVDWVRMKLWI